MKKPRKRVLIVKTGQTELLESGAGNDVVSLGDVLRATPLLNLYRRCEVTWITDRRAVPLLARIGAIDRLLSFRPRTMESLRREEFDTVINLEKNPTIVAALRRLTTRQWYGFSPNGHRSGDGGRDLPPRHPPPNPSDTFRRRNSRTTQELLFEMVGARWNREKYVLGYPRRTAPRFDVGLNTEVGRKWPTKKWPSANWDALEHLLTRSGLTVTRQDRQGGTILHSIEDYIRWIDSSRLIVTGDTLGMHLGIALAKQVVALFGPTPFREVHFYGRGLAMLPDPRPRCMPCLKGTCGLRLSCMERITPARVFRRVRAFVDAN